MKPNKHILVSFSLGAAVWFFSRSLAAGAICFLSGFLVDFDHIIDYLCHHGWKGFTFKKFYRACEQTEKGKGEYSFKKIYFIFHSIEAAFLLCLLALYTKNVYVFSAALGYAAHLALDQIGNNVRPHCYFILGRARSGFNPDKLLRRKQAKQVKSFFK